MMNEWVFWLCTLVILLISSAIFIIPIYRGKTQDQAATRDALNKAFYQDRVAELENEKDGGLVGNQKELALELKQSLLDDIPQSQLENEQQDNQRLPFALLLPAVLIFVFLSYGLYATFGSYNQVMAWQKTAQRLPELSSFLLNSDENHTMSEQDLTDLILALRTQMEKTPNDATGWLLLGRIALESGDVRTAEGAMEKAYDLNPNDIPTQLGYAQSLMMTGDEANSQRARNLLNDVIAEDHSNLQAFSLLSFDAFEQGNYERAIDLWSIMKTLLAPNDPRVQMLDRSISRARAQLQPAMIGKEVNATIRLADGVDFDPNSTLLISVHSEDGAPMPIAVKRLPISNFPIQVRLTDADSMLPERLLSSLSNVIVKARIDQDGNVMTKDGDWEGQSEIVALGQPVDVVIADEN